MPSPFIESLRRDIRYHDRRHPADMGAEEVRTFLSHLASDRHVAINTQRSPGARWCFSTPSFCSLYWSEYMQSFSGCG